MKKVTKTVCYVLCYKHTDYTRTNALIHGLKKIPDCNVVVLKNKKRGIARYVEVPIKLLYYRLKYRPDTLVVGFRSHEIFWALYPSMIGKRIIFDEFINSHDWLLNEHKKSFSKPPVMFILDTYMKLVIALSVKVLTDTKEHAALMTEVYGVKESKVQVIPISADEDLYHPEIKKTKRDKNFNVIFYGSMLPLHGVWYVLDALVYLKKANKISGISLTFAGGKGKTEFIKKLNDFVQKNQLQDNFTHIPWVESDKLPEFIAGFDIALGGPFGNTGQGNRVITGKTYQLLAMGMPVIAGKIPTMKGFVDKKNCILVEQGSSKQIADAILWAQQNNTKLSAIGINGAKLYKKYYSSETVSQLLAEIV